MDEAMASHPSQPEAARARHRGSRRGGTRCSHSIPINVPSLDLGSNMTLQLAHEHNGSMLAQANDGSQNHRRRILRALHDRDVDLAKAQMCGHCHQLTAGLAESLLHYLLFVKGQLPDPVNVLRKKKSTASSDGSNVKRRRSSSSSNRSRKEDKLLRKLQQLRQSLQDAVSHLDSLSDNHGEGPSSRPHEQLPSTISPKDVRLIIVMGASATMPREVFVLDMVQSVGRCRTAASVVHDTAGPDSLGDVMVEDTDTDVASLLSEASNRQRDAARAKTGSNWERKLVRLLVSDERLEGFMGAPLAPTKTHVLLSAPSTFRCPGWSIRHHVDFDLDHLNGPDPTATDEVDAVTPSMDTSISPSAQESGTCDRKRAPPSPSQPQDGRWLKNKLARDSSSSVAESWVEDSASDLLVESSISSVSDDSRPPSAADKPWPVGSSQAAAVAQSWLATCDSPRFTTTHSPDCGPSSLRSSRTGSSLGSSTIHAHDSNDSGTNFSDRHVSSCEDLSMVAGQAEAPMDDKVCKLPNPAVTTHDSALEPRRRSREPKEGGLLSRNLLRAKQSRQSSCTASDSSSVRSVGSSMKRAPRCAGLRIDFTDPEQTASIASTPPSSSIGTAFKQPKIDRCWFQCEAVLEGFR
ncbi:hypothetical protein PHSY_005763 [Pseudozyma hubeiensis SY62]|uniref:Uncharacterized protein n=1 Tax=Pseudozyma hubeiensis (strain SY62) TaxID=1305764 RepID=R9P9Z3_PSEHS|nr:hypothetical protein PHSY_005763 [Pseudozyma hubeiensis SY62]GAC98174.1 hypothetical protein PHSY_005763 [Pseudozyma hubeiensis SY62]